MIQDYIYSDAYSALKEVVGKAGDQISKNYVPMFVMNELLIELEKRNIILVDKSQYEKMQYQINAPI